MNLGVWAGSPGASPPSEVRSICHRVALPGQGWLSRLAWWQDKPWGTEGWFPMPCLQQKKVRQQEVGDSLGNPVLSTH